MNENNNNQNNNNSNQNNNNRSSNNRSNIIEEYQQEWSGDLSEMIYLPQQGSRSNYIEGMFSSGNQNNNSGSSTVTPSNFIEEDDVMHLPPSSIALYSNHAEEEVIHLPKKSRRAGEALTDVGGAIWRLSDHNNKNNKGGGGSSK